LVKPFFLEVISASCVIWQSLPFILQFVVDGLLQPGSGFSELEAAFALRAKLSDFADVVSRFLAGFSN
jgi:hypothetical protein